MEAETLPPDWERVGVVKFFKQYDPHPPPCCTMEGVRTTGGYGCGVWENLDSHHQVPNSNNDRLSPSFTKKAGELPIFSELPTLGPRISVFSLMSWVKEPSPDFSVSFWIFYMALEKEKEEENPILMPSSVMTEIDIFLPFERDGDSKINLSWFFKIKNYTN